MVHAKVVTVDRVAALIGSTNFNRRSLDHDEEVMLAERARELAVRPIRRFL